ncbi:MAG: tRNA pseudouridine(55) synthase TruB [Bacilli bacterium]|nr:tRNA pseudouridine(55) synthase TruB [Bacilli bacterium]
MNGILLVNKEKDMTSRDVVNILSKKFDTGRVGHTGTLDPIATGIMGIAINDGLKIVDFLISDSKEYIATVKIGLDTDTLDITGNILEEVENFSISKEEIEEALNSFLGKSIQEVPIYSALKVNGKRLYEYARENIKVELPKREIEVFDIELLEFNNNEFKFKVHVSKGTYIRSLIRDIGKKINIPCVMKDLQRTKQGNFKIENSYTLEEIKNDKYKFISIKDALDGYKFIEVNSYIENKIRNGRILENRYDEEFIVFINSSDEVLAIYKVYEKDKTKIKPIKVISGVKQKYV